MLTFDRMRGVVSEVVNAVGLASDLDQVYIVRDLYGTLGIVVSEALEADEVRRAALDELVRSLNVGLGAHGVRERGVFFADQDTLDSLRAQSQVFAAGFSWVDRLVTGRDWWTVKPRDRRCPRRVTLYSIKGGVGRSTTAAVLASHLARQGEQVLVVDLDLESPGLSSAMLDRDVQPGFGVTDWFVEDLVKQGDTVLEDIVGSPKWAGDLEGGVSIVPAYGSEPGEYLAKLGRVYMGDDWTDRLQRLLGALEVRFQPTVTLIESRSGLHDIAASAVTDLGADVLLFAMNSENHWTNYDMLFRHWQLRDLAPKIRQRLAIVSAMTPVNDQKAYLTSFRERSWDLFRDRLYDDTMEQDALGSTFSFDLGDEDAPHAPLPIYWNLGLASGGGLLDLDETGFGGAYAHFLSRFDGLVSAEEDDV